MKSRVSIGSVRGALRRGALRVGECVIVELTDAVWKKAVPCALTQEQFDAVKDAPRAGIPIMQGYRN